MAIKKSPTVIYSTEKKNEMNWNHLNLSSNMKYIWVFFLAEIQSSEKKIWFGIGFLFRAPFNIVGPNKTKNFLIHQITKAIVILKSYVQNTKKNIRKKKHFRVLCLKLSFDRCVPILYCLFSCRKNFSDKMVFFCLHIILCLFMKCFLFCEMLNSSVFIRRYFVNSFRSLSLNSNNLFLLISLEMRFWKCSKFDVSLFRWVFSRA